MSSRHSLLSVAFLRYFTPSWEPVGYEGNLKCLVCILEIFINEFLRLLIVSKASRPNFVLGAHFYFWSSFSPRKTNFYRENLVNRFLFIFSSAFCSFWTTSGRFSHFCKFLPIFPLAYMSSQGLQTSISAEFFDFLRFSLPFIPSRRDS